MGTIIKENTKQYNRDMADSGLPHQSVTKYNRDYPQLLQLKQQVQDKKKQGQTTRVYMRRHSSYQGYKEDCSQHMLGTPKYLPPVFSFVENGIIHLAFNYSARKGDFLEYQPILRKLRKTPTELIFEKNSRIGREYSVGARISNGKNLTYTYTDTIIIDDALYHRSTRKRTSWATVSKRSFIEQRIQHRR